MARALGATELQAALQASRIDILRAAQNTQQVFTKSATALIENLSAAQKQWQRAFTNDEIRAVRRALLDSAAADRASDYAEAEQIYYGFESLCYALDDIDQCTDTLDLLFESIADSDTYSPRNFSRLAKKLAARF